jgi:DNA-binding NarL/FixJ family response regulator
VRVLIADDHTLVRAGLRRLIESFADMSVVAEASTGREALELALLHKPDVALLDLSMPQGGGMDVAAELGRSLPQIAVVVISMHADLAHVREALDRGARGYVVKDGAVAELEMALRSALAGQTFLSPQISGRMVDELLRGEKREGISALSPRQRDILARLGRGESSKEIASNLDISIKTVETHRKRMMETLGCRRANDLLRVAMKFSTELG